MSKTFVISGQSGVGKGAIQKELKKKHSDFYDVITCTTRAPRPHETDSKDYYFLTKEKFEQKIKSNGFLEYAHVHDWMYGTPKSEIEKAKELEKNIFLEIDVQGAVNVKKILPEAILIFISFEDGDLEKLIKNRTAHDPQRNNFTEDEIKRRIESAKDEEKYKKYYDYVVVNPEGHPEEAIKEIEIIIQKELKNGQ